MAKIQVSKNKIKEFKQQVKKLDTEIEKYMDKCVALNQCRKGLQSIIDCGYVYDTLDIRKNANRGKK